jgi:hypothetical protein
MAKKKGFFSKIISKLDKKMVEKSKQECSCSSKASAKKNDKKACKDDEDCGCCN